MLTAKQRRNIASSRAATHQLEASHASTLFKRPRSQGMVSISERFLESRVCDRRNQHIPLRSLQRH